MPTIAQWLVSTNKKLQKAGIESSRLDSELLLAEALGKPRTWLKAHPEQIFEGATFEKVEAWCSRREQREPLAYIVGYREFYGRKFNVTPDVLIPRPESEALIEMAKSCNLAPGDSILDAGTGSGCLGISLKLELPASKVTLLDFSPRALKIAAANAKILAASVDLVEQDILQINYSSHLLGAPYKLIVANLPYVDAAWPCSPETANEPSVALFSEAGGLWHYINFLAAALHFLQKNGYLVVEADPRQQADLISYAKKLEYELVARDHFALLFSRQNKQIDVLRHPTAPSS